MSQVDGVTVEDPTPGGAVIHLQGGATTYVEMSPVDVVHCIEDAVSSDEERKFLWLQPRNRPDNSVAIDPREVVAVFRRVTRAS